MSRKENDDDSDSFQSAAIWVIAMTFMLLLVWLCCSMQGLR